MERSRSHNAIAIAAEDCPATTSGASEEPKPVLPRQTSAVPIVASREKRKEAGCPSSAASSATSSIGEDDSQDEEEDEDEVKSGSRSAGPLDGMAQSLESSLPLKRGLSSFFGGKSRSFTCLNQVKSSSSAEELAKPESPHQYAYNKRRKMERRWKRPEKASSLWSGVGVVVVGTNKLNIPRSFSVAYVQRIASSS